MAEDKQVKKYFENMTYGRESLSSEIHGKKNQVVINKIITSLVRNYDKHIAEGNKDMAGHFKSQIEEKSRELDGLKAIKEEFAMNYGSGKGGKNMYSNYTNLNWERAFMTEQGEITLDSTMQFQLGVTDESGETVWKKREDITENWVIKGTEENDFMTLQQNAIKQRNTMGEALDYDIDWEVSKILGNEDAWKVFASDKIGGRYFLNDYVMENQEAIQSGEIPDNMLHPDSFDPDFDNRLHEYYASRIRKSFDENYQTPAEARKADELIARTTPQDNTENNQV